VENDDKIADADVAYVHGNMDVRLSYAKMRRERNMRMVRR